jgi:hypothetical protein
LEIKISSVSNGMLIDYVDEEEGTEGQFSFTNKQEAYEKLAELVAELEMDVVWDDETKKLNIAISGKEDKK